MKKIIILSLFLLLGSAFADSFPSFPMSIYGNIKIGATNISAGTVNIYNSSNTELASYVITESGKYGADMATDTALTLNEFTGNITIKVIYNGTTYTVAQSELDDTNKGEGCPTKSGITFVSQNCRYDITLPQPVSPPPSGGDGGGNDPVIITPPNTGTINTGELRVVEVISSGEIENNLLHVPQFNQNYTQEFNDAYGFAFVYGITTMGTIEEANMEGNLIRAHMAKMMVNYAMDVIGLTGDQTKECNFDDIQDQSNEMKQYIRLACQLNIMGVGITSFNPEGLVTRAEFGTVLSRVLYGNAYNDGEFFYSNHLKALKDNGIITNDNPMLEELRGYVMLMLMRVGE